VTANEPRNLPNLSEWTLSDVEQKPDAYLFRWATTLLKPIIQALSQRGEVGAYCQLYQHGTNPMAPGVQELKLDRLDRGQGRLAIAQRFDEGLDGVAGFSCFESGPPNSVRVEAFWTGRDSSNGDLPFGGSGFAVSLALKRTITGKLRPIDGNANIEFPAPELPKFR